MDKKLIQEKVMQILSHEEIFIDSEIVAGIDEEDSLETYGMDSFGFINMIVKLEQEFNIEIPNEFLRFEKWGTIKNIVESLCEIECNN